MTRGALAAAALWSAPIVLLALALAGYGFVAQGGFAPYAVPRAAGREAELGPAGAQDVARGAYLARLGNCAACHTRRGGAAYAGGRAFATPWGRVHSTNLTPDRDSGIGDWSRAEFRHAMRHGVSRNGVQYPVFPYANFARLDDADLDALHAYLRTVAPVSAPRPRNLLEFPANLRGALVLWRMRYERMPMRAAEPDPVRARGRYLVEGIAHCNMCHGARDARGALHDAVALGGATMPGLGWYAPPLGAKQLARYAPGELADYLRTGTSRHGDAYGPMAEVVFEGLQHLSAADADAIAAYLESAPADETVRGASEPAVLRASARDDRGRTVYDAHCADCHGKDGRGMPGKFPALRGSVAATAPEPANAIRMVLNGGVAPATRGNPLPYSMPPYAQTLTREEIAAVVEHVRTVYGDRPGAVGAADVDRHGGIELD